jgi:N-acetylmuramoyl-L-alanine amidase
LLTSKNKNLSAGVFFVDTVTERTLKKVFKDANSNKDKIKILIVPGHDKDSWGTQFNGLKELDLNLALGQELFDLFKKDKRFEVILSQTDEGYHPKLLSYFESKQNDILEYVGEQKASMLAHMEKGKIESVINVEHNFAAPEVVLKLYGINKWANENKVDIVLHLHFNDYPGRPRTAEGKYSGFSMYVPESQFSNSKGSMPLAKLIKNRLDVLYPQSNLPTESGGIIESQELIAIGANNTLDSAAVLIEYGYIYEPIVSNPELRLTSLSDLALQTYSGVLDFFDEEKQNPFIRRLEAAENDGADFSKKVKSVNNFSTRFMPYEWRNDLIRGELREGPFEKDIASLQVAMILEGIYPPSGETKNDCGITGYFGRCTETAVKLFQEKYNIYPANGVVGALTRAKLNEIY